MKMCLWEDKFKGKTTHFRLPSASQKRACLSSLNRDFKIRDATASRAVADKGLGLERRRLRAKSKVKIPVSMQDDAVAKTTLYQCDSSGFLSQK